jgi:hypothetical protein
MKQIIKKTCLAFITLVTILIVSCKSDSNPVTDENLWNQDLDYLAEELPKRHINLFANISSESFYNEINTLKQISSEFDYNRMFFSIMKIVASAGDAHTLITPKDPSTFNLFPVEGYWFAEGYYITSASTEYQQILGKRLIRINNHSIEEVFDLVKPLISHENNQQLKNSSPQYFMSADVLSFIKVLDKTDKADFFFEGIGNLEIKSFSYSSFAGLNFVNLLIENNTSLPYYLQNTSRNYWYTYIEENKLLYFQYNLCRESNDKTFQAFVNELFSFADNNTVDKLVVDLRNNPGGSSPIFRTFINGIKARPEINLNGKLFVITGRKTFSSAMLNTLEMKSETNALFYGEPTGAKPNHFGEQKSFDLPNLAITVGYSTKYFNYSSENTPTFTPDILVEISFDNYINGIDPVLEKIIEY